MYVIKLTWTIDNRPSYVARPGAEHSYTPRLEEAWVFDTREEAKRMACPRNEVVVSVVDIMKGGR